MVDEEQEQDTPSAPEFRAVVDIMLRRIETNPEEFIANQSPHSFKWQEALDTINRWGTSEEKRAIKTAMSEVNLQAAYEKVMKKILAPETPKYTAAQAQQALEAYRGLHDSRAQQALSANSLFSPLPSPVTWVSDAANKLLGGP